MKNSAQKIRTSHCGRLPNPPGFDDMSFKLASGQATPDEVTARVVPAVADAIKRQVEIGIDCIGDGEFWSGLGVKWYEQQMSRPRDAAAASRARSRSMRESTRERDVFRTLYADMDRVGTIACIPGERPIPKAQQRVIVSGPVKTKGTAATQRQLDCFKAAIARAGRRGRRDLRPRARAGLARPFHL